jgi:CTP synthase
MVTQIKINYKEYPEFMFAIISAYLPEEEARIVSKLAGEVIFKTENNNGDTFKNGLRHSYNDLPAINKTYYKVNRLKNNQIESIYIFCGNEERDKNIDDLKEIDGVIVPGGFDKRGVEGKIEAIRYCRENKVPFLGICLGLQCAVIEFARNVLKMEGATSQEFDSKTPFPVIHFVAGQSADSKKSATMRLGAYDCELEKDTIVRELYKKKTISERHRHRYEVNNEFINKYEEKGFIVSGRNPDSGLIEMMEMKREIHPYFLGTQAHPEFKSRLGEPAPLFDGLIKSAIERR